MPDAILEVLITLPAQIVVAWGFTRVLPMRCAVLFAVLNVAVVTFLDAVGEYFVSGTVGFVFLFAVGFVLPFLLYRGSAFVKAVVVVAVNLIDNLALFVSYGVWTLLLQAPVPDDMGLYYEAIRAYPAPFAVSEVVRIALAVALFLLLAFLVRKRAGGVSSSLKFTLLFLLTQTAFTLEMLVVFAMLDLPVELCVGGCLVLGGCLMADGFLFASMERFGRAQSEEARAEMADSQLEESLAAYTEVVEEIERAGRVRHDLRNQLQVVGVLAEEGNTQRARAQIATLKGLLDDDGCKGRAAV